MVFEILLVLSLAFGIIATCLAIMSKPKWYWTAGLCIYIFSCIGAWSIGGYTLSIAYLLLALAIGHSLSIIKNLYHSVITIIVSLLLWGIIFKTLDDTWWYLFPFALFIGLLFYGLVRKVIRRTV